MSQRQRHPRFRLAKTVTTVAYAALTTLVPVQHALQETVIAEQSIEANHSDECPRLHAGPACVVAALSLFAMPAAQLRLGVNPQSGRRASGEASAQLGSSSIPNTHWSRAPPHLL